MRDDNPDHEISFGMTLQRSQEKAQEIYETVVQPQLEEDKKHQNPLTHEKIRFKIPSQTTIKHESPFEEAKERPCIKLRFKVNASYVQVRIFGRRRYLEEIHDNEMITGFATSFVHKKKGKKYQNLDIFLTKNSYQEKLPILSVINLDTFVPNKDIQKISLNPQGGAIILRSA